MSLDALYQALDDARHDGRITLLPGLVEGMGGVLSALGVPDLVLAGTRLSRSASAVTLAGSTAYRGNGADGELVGEVAGAGYRFTLTLSLQEDRAWTFSRVFANLPEMLASEGGNLVPRPSYLAATRVQQPAFRATNLDAATGAPGLAFTGWLLLAGPLERYAAYFGAGPFGLAGAVTLRDPDPPLLELAASLLAQPVTVGGTALEDVGLRLSVVLEDTSFLGDGEMEPVSLLELTAGLSLGSVHVGLFAPLLQGDQVWALRAEIEDYTEQLSGGLAQLATLFGVQPGALPVPDTLSGFASFYLSEVGVGLVPSETGFLPSLSYVSATVVSKREWKPPVPFISICRVGTRWLFTFPPGQSTPLIGGSVFGTVRFGAEGAPCAQLEEEEEEAADGFAFDVVATVPQFRLQARLAVDEEIDLGEVFTWFFGAPGPATGLVVTDLQFLAVPSSQLFSFEATMTTPWRFSLGAVTFYLDFLEMWVTSARNGISGGITGGLLIDDQSPGEGVHYDGGAVTPPEFLVSADYVREGGWTFVGELYPGSTLELVRLVSKFLDATPPGWVAAFSLSIERLRVTFNTESGTFALAGKVVGRWKPRALGVELSLTAEADVERRARTRAGDLALRADPADGAGEMVLVGTLSGSFAVNRFLVGAGVTLTESEPTYTFRIQYGDVWFTGTTFLVEQKDGGTHQAVRFRLGGVTFGAMLEYLVNLARPTADFRLDPPWDFLNSIQLSSFALTVDPTENSVALTYDVGLSLPFAQVSTVGLKYVRENSQGSVKIVLVGSLLGQPQQELAWDAVDDPPPAVPGEGPQLLKLRYLGLGQHVRLQGDYKTVPAVLAAMRGQLRPVEDPKQNPLRAPLAFDENSHWLFGIDATVMDTVTLGIVFNDPQIYGLVVALGGPRAGSFGGLRFELLYKRVTDDVGVFRVELKLPDAFRQLDFGAVSVTLAIITVEIYTNGDFRIDLGFPWNGDFSRSFAVQYFPFIGKGGIYFGRLSGATSTRVPAVTNGNFSPVLELGVGLAVGLGKEFNKGPLRAGLSVQVEVIFEGVLAWFNPTDASARSATFYSLKATAGIVGELYGEVDFKVIKVSVSVEAYASVAVVMESYRATLFTLRAGVRVRASIKILFININFSFGLEVQESFVVGRDTTPPWRLADGQSGRTQGRLARSLAPPRRRTHLETRLLTLHAARGSTLRAGRAAAPAGPDGYTLDWRQVPVFPAGAVRDVALTLLPAFTVAGIPVAWDPAAASAPGDDPAYRLVFLLFAEHGIDPHARTLAGTHRVSAERSTHAADTADLAFNVVIEAMFRWSLSAAGIGPVEGSVTSGELAELARQMAMPQTADAGFAFENLDGFLAKNLKLVVTGRPASPTSAAAADASGTCFPMIPLLRWESAEVPARDFQRDRQIGATYEHRVAAYFASLAVNPLAGVAADGTERRATAIAGDPEPTESMATFIFRDYLLLVARSAVQEALDLLEAYPFLAGAGDSLRSIASPDNFPRVGVPYELREGDTTDEVAAAFGLSAAGLLFLNPEIETELRQPPGTVLTVHVGVTPEGVAVSAQDRPLVPGKTLELGSVRYQVEEGRSLAEVAARFGLGSAADLLGPVPPGATPLADDPQLLRAGATLRLADVAYADPTGMGTTLVAAVFWIRLHGADGVPWHDWYAQAVFDLNAAPGLTFAGVLPAGTLLRVPAALHDAATPPLGYTSLPGDTLDRIGGYFALAQNFSAARDPAGDFGRFEAQVRALNPTGAPPFTLPSPLEHVLQPRETLASLAERFFFADAAALVTAVAGQGGILAPLALVHVPGVKHATVAGDTLLSVAQTYALSVEELGSREGVAGVEGIFAPDEKEDTARLLLRDVPCQTISALVALLQGDVVSPRISGMVSRFMLAGLRLPVPVPPADGGAVVPGEEWAGLYELTGQQVPGPAPTPACDSTVRVSVTVTPTETRPWIELRDSEVADGAEAGDALRTARPRLAELNPALHLPGRLRAGAVLHTGVVGALAIEITDKDLCENYPSPTLGLKVVNPLRPMQLFQLSPRTYGLERHLTWQAAAPPTFPAPPADAPSPPVAGTPGLWVFPSGLLAQAPGGGATRSPFALRVADDRTGLDRDAQPVRRYGWGTLVEVRVRRTDADDAPASPNTYVVAGVDPAGRALLLELFRYLDPARKPQESATQLFLLYAPGADAANPQGLVSEVLDPAATYLVKTNVSTETTSGGFAAGDERDTAELPATGPYFASLDGAGRDAAGLRDLVRLLWEASVVGTGGFYLRYTRREDGGGLPDALFAGGGGASVWLAVLLGSQCAGDEPDRTLHAFNNVAAVGDNLDPTAQQLFAEAADGSQTVKLATVQPGNVGFDMVLANPEAEAAPDAALTRDQLTRQLYSLLGYRVAEGSDAFRPSVPGLPAGPTEVDDALLPLHQRHARLLAARRLGEPEPGGDNWLFRRVVPVASFAASHPLPAVAGLPDPERDPYAGIAAGAKAPMAVWFNDVYGNASAGGAGTGVDCAEPPVPGQVCAPVGYTDDLIGPAEWPGITPGYRVEKPGDAHPGAWLSIRFALQPGAYMPAPGAASAAARDTASAHGVRWARAYYQLMQADVTCDLLTSLEQAPGAEPSPLQVGMGPLRDFAAGACVYLGTAARLRPVAPDVAAYPTLDAVSAAYGVSYAELASANAGAPLRDVFGAGTLAVPRYAPWAQGSTAASVAAAPPSGMGPVDPARLLLAPANVGLPLLPGAALLTPRREFTLGGDPVALAEAARDHHAGVGRLAEANAGTRGLLVGGATLVYDDLEVAVGETGDPAATESFDDLAARLVAAGADPRTTGADVATANQDVPGLLRGGATLAATDWVAAAGETLDRNGSGFAAQQLVALNTGTAGIFPDGTALYFGAQDVGLAPGQTLADVAGAYGATGEQLLAHHAGTALAAGSGLVVPGAAALPADPADVHLACAVRDGDTLEMVAGRFALAGGSAGERALALATANQRLPGVLAGGRTITVAQGWEAPTHDGDSFQAVLDRFAAGGHDVQLADVAAAIGGTAGYLRDGALLITPAAQAPAGADPATLQELADAYGVDVPALAAANAGLPDLLVPGKTLAVRVGERSYTVTTAAHDTLNALLGRLVEQVNVSLEEVALALAPVPLVRPGASLLVPPPAREVRVAVGAAGARYPGAVFPVRVQLRLQRDPALLDPGFVPAAGEPPSPVQLSLSAVPPRPDAAKGREDGEGNAVPDAPLNLREFARVFQGALPALRVATSHAGGATQGTTDGGGPASQDVWAVNFSATGIRSVGIRPSVEFPAGSGNLLPRFFALRPLATRLASQQVAVQELEDNGRLGAEQALSLQGIDLEVWARDFLAAVDLFLSAPYAAPVYALNGGAQRASFTRLMRAKETLAAAVAAGVDYVLDTGASAGPDDPARKSARDALRQKLGISLASAYDTDAIVQLDSAVSSTFAAGGALASLSGQARALPLLPPEEGCDPPVRVKQFTLGNARTSLESGGAYVNFALSVRSEELYASATLNLEYVVNELEFDILPVPGAEGYTSSRWLTFVLPFGEAGDLPPGVDFRLGQFDVPLPLRTYPEAPVLVSQGGSASRGDDRPPAGIPEAKLWSYAFAYELREAAQDTVRFSVDVNEPPPEQPPAQVRLAAVPTLFEALAQYTRVADRLWGMLAGLLRAGPGTTDETLGNAVDTFATLVEGVAGAWTRHWAGGGMVHRDRRLAAGGSAPPPQSFDYDVRLDSTADDGAVYYRHLTLRFDPAQAWPGSGPPAVVCTRGDGVAVGLAPGASGAGFQVYDFPPDPERRIPASTRVQFAYSFPDLDVVAKQNALTRTRIARNEGIYHVCLHGRNTEVPVSAGFVFRTPEVGFAGATTPLLAWERPFDVTHYAPGELERAIGRMFEAVVGSDSTGSELAAAVQYGYVLVRDPDDPAGSIVSYLPVKFMPRFTYGAGVPAGLREALDDWWGSSHPATDGGQWVFSVSVYSAVDPQLLRPILELRHLFYEIGATPADD